MILTAILPLVMGIVAVLHWRRNQQPVHKGFGLVRNGVVMRDIGAGLLIPFIAFLAIFLILLLIGAIQVTGTRFDVGMLGSNIAIFIIGGIFEEILYRALLLNGLVIVLRGNKWLAIIISAIIFGFAHALNPNATAITAFGTGLGGLIYGIAFLGGKNIWLPLALHFSWNFSQAFFGFIVSGYQFWGLFTLNITGTDILTGGAYGPEASIIGMTFRFVIIGMVLWYLWRTRRTQHDVRTLEYIL